MSEIAQHGEPSVSVIVPCHDSRGDYLNRVLSALKCQTLPYMEWELVVIDNASDPPLSGWVDVSWHPQGRVLREDTLGLTPARLRRIAESRGDLLVFVDDDNVPDSAYLEKALDISRNWPWIGAWGGSVAAEFEIRPPDYITPILGMRKLGNIWAGRPQGKVNRDRARTNTSSVVRRRSICSPKRGLDLQEASSVPRLSRSRSHFPLRPCGRIPFRPRFRMGEGYGVTEKSDQKPGRQGAWKARQSGQRKLAKHVEADKVPIDRGQLWMDGRRHSAIAEIDRSATGRVVVRVGYISTGPFPGQNPSEPIPSPTHMVRLPFRCDSTRYRASWLSAGTRARLPSRRAGFTLHREKGTSRRDSPFVRGAPSQLQGAAPAGGFGQPVARPATRLPLGTYWPGAFGARNESGDRRARACLSISAGGRDGECEGPGADASVGYSGARGCRCTGWKPGVVWCCPDRSWGAGIARSGAECGRHFGDRPTWRDRFSRGIGRC